MISHSKFNPHSYWYALHYEGRHSYYTSFFSEPRPPLKHGSKKRYSLIFSLWISNDLTGVCHVDDLIYLFNNPNFDNNATEALLSSRMLDVWTTFAKYGWGNYVCCPSFGLIRYLMANGIQWKVIGKSILWCQRFLIDELPFLRSNPTPDGVSMMEGIPRFPAITEEEDAYMDIDGMWTVQRNFSSTYTITVDEMRDEFYGSLPEDTNDQHTFDWWEFPWWLFYQ